MAVHSFSCIDAHTCGNPVRVVAEGGPILVGASMMERRLHFLREFDWIRTGLMFEPRGHDQMSGSILYEPTRDDCDVGVLFIETSGCLPMCGHGTIGTVTVMIQERLVDPAVAGVVRLDTPAGRVDAFYEMDGDRVSSVRLVNVPSFLHSAGCEIECAETGRLMMDVAYGGNFYAIVEPQETFRDMADYTAADLIRMSRAVRRELNRSYEFVHPEDPVISGCSHILWAGRPTVAGADARNAVFYGDKAIDRSPCGTGTSSRMAQLAARGELAKGDTFVHESIIGSLFRGRVESVTTVGDFDAIVPSIAGWARVTGYNRILIDEDDPYAHGFQVI
jgi:4-hydroxyproline epimerase